MKFKSGVVSFPLGLSSIHAFSSLSNLKSRTSCENLIFARGTFGVSNHNHPNNISSTTSTSSETLFHSHDLKSQPTRLHHTSFQIFMSSNTNENDDNYDGSSFVNANDGEALQGLFANHCDGEGLMTKDTLQTDIVVIKDLLDVGDLLQEELNDIWNAAPKFPDINGTNEQRIDVDSFIQIYRDIDDIFVDDEEDDDEGTNNAAILENKESKIFQEENNHRLQQLDKADVDDTKKSSGDDIKEDINDNDDDSEDDEEEDERELENSFKTICDETGLVSKQTLMEWNEIRELLDENELGIDEFNEIWNRTSKSPGSSDMIDVEGFLSFNVALDDMFEFIDDDKDDDELKTKALKQIPMFYGEDLPPGVIFAEIADDNYLVGMDELRRWGDLQDMLSEGDLLPLELQNIYEGISKSQGTDKLTEEGFESLFQQIDALFETFGDDDIEDDDNKNETLQSVEVPKQTFGPTPKQELLSAISKLAMDEERVPCGLQSTEEEIETILEITKKLELESSNMVSGEIDINPSDVAGKWELMFTTSSTMKFNKSLSGLVPPNGKFDSLVQKFKASNYLSDVEYVEQINAGPASFEVKVTGDWELKNTISLFTGARSVVLSVQPDRVSYGITSQRADHWKSLGPMNLLEISYLDEDLRIMRGTTAIDSIFIFKRVQ